MGANAGLPAINEIVHFLNKYAATEVARLSAQDKDYKDLLSIGVIGGEREIPTETERARAIRARTDILAVALLHAVSKVDERTFELQAKLRRARILHFIATVCASATAMGAAATALFGRHTATMVLSLFSLAANIANAAGTSLVLGGRKDVDVIHALSELSRGRAFATLTSGLLEAARKGNFSTADVTLILKDANAHYRELSEALAKSEA